MRSGILRDRTILIPRIQSHSHLYNVLLSTWLDERLFMVKPNASEENLLNDQFDGWNVQKSQIRNVCALPKLLLILAFATRHAPLKG